MSIPPHLAEAQYEPAPAAIGEFAAGCGCDGVFFADDPRCRQSVRFNETVFVNARCTYWTKMIAPPFWCREVCEAILLRTLHEIGHLHKKHTSDPNILSTSAGLEIHRTGDSWAEYFTGQEGEAWEFALEVRSTQPGGFASMLQACRDWYHNHAFAGKDWDDSREEQWRRRHGQDFAAARFNPPDWFCARFAKYQPREV